VALIARGAKVVAHGRRSDALVELAREAPDRVSVAIGDLADASARDALVERAVEQLGGLDGLVHAAGVVRYEGVGAIDESHLRRQLEINFVAPLLLAQQAAPHLRESRGAMVFVSSTLASRAAPLTAAYAGSKAALEAATRTLAIELAPEVRVNAVAPGVVDTPMVRQLRVSPGETLPEDPSRVVEEQMKVLRELHPLRRLGRPEDVASAVLYLLDAPWTTGSVMTVDGGLSAG